MNTKFPFGIDPAGQVPEPSQNVTVVVEASQDFNGGRITFDHPFEPIPVLVAQVKLVRTPSKFWPGNLIICNDVRGASERITITGWNPATRVLSVKLEKSTLPVVDFKY